MKKIAILSLACLLFCNSHGTTNQPKPTLKTIVDKTTDMNLQEFCDVIQVPEDQRQDFARFYSSKTQRRQRVKSRVKRQAWAQRVRDVGRSALEVERPELYKQLIALEKGYQSPRACVVQNARLFLTRYGAWHEYTMTQATSQGGLWAKVKGFARNGKQRVAQWFGRREPVTVAVNEK